jgi:hypothetical protein
MRYLPALGQRLGQGLPLRLYCNRNKEVLHRGWMAQGHQLLGQDFNQQQHPEQWYIHSQGVTKYRTSLETRLHADGANAMGGGHPTSSTAELGGLGMSCGLGGHHSPRKEEEKEAHTGT